MTTFLINPDSNTSAYISYTGNTAADCTITGTSTFTSSTTSLQKSDGTVIYVDDIITQKDLTNENFLWKQLFTSICLSNPDKMPDYMTTFKLYNEDYKQAVLAIETAKKEV